MGIRKLRPHTKVNQVMVDEMRRRYDEGATQRELGDIFQLSTVQVGRIVRGEAWKGTFIRPEPTQEEIAESSRRMQALLGTVQQEPSGVERLVEEARPGQAVAEALRLMTEQTLPESVKAKLVQFGVRAPAGPGPEEPNDGNE